MLKKSIILIGAAVLVILISAVILRRGLFRDRDRERDIGSLNACVNNLRYSDATTEQWALENKKASNDVPTWENLRPLLAYGEILKCPQGGAYTLGTLTKRPTCTRPGHTLP